MLHCLKYRLHLGKSVLGKFSISYDFVIENFVLLAWIKKSKHQFFRVVLCNNVPIRMNTFRSWQNLILKVMFLLLAFWLLCAGSANMQKSKYANTPFKM